jgi:prepilin peptidase CpaA
VIAFVHHLCLALLALLLVVAAVGDWRRFIIPNRLCLAVAALALPYWLSSGAPLWPTLAWQLLLAAAAFAAFAGLFALGVMGGGDVKLFAALALWLPLGKFVGLLLVSAVLGGFLTLALLAAHRARRKAGQPEIPYGVAIAGGALLIIVQPIVNGFAG